MSTIIRIPAEIVKIEERKKTVWARKKTYSDPNSNEIETETISLGWFITVRFQTQATGIWAETSFGIGLGEKPEAPIIFQIEARKP